MKKDDLITPCLYQVSVGDMHLDVGLRILSNKLPFLMACTFGHVVTTDGIWGKMI